jgi:AcrR family transcriptional regulator
MPEIPPLQTMQQQIVDAAIRCIERWGMERVTMNDIAYEARLARSTVYSYYKNREEVVKAALLLSAYSFGEKLYAHISQLRTAEERLVEAVVYSLQSIPDEPFLAIISDKALTDMVREKTLTSPEGVDMGTMLFKTIFQDDSYSLEELKEISEFSIRFLLSLLLLESPQNRSEKELRGFIARRLLPAIGLTTPAQYDLFRRPKQANKQPPVKASGLNLTMEN